MTRNTAPQPSRSWTGETSDPHKWLVAFETITVSTYADESMRATHGRLDRGSKRMVFTQLPDPQPIACERGVMAHYLAEAAVGHLGDTHDQLALY